MPVDKRKFAQALKISIPADVLRAQKKPRSLRGLFSQEA
jgi:hypothetical protein